MRVAVISDVHGNLHALEAVLAALDGERPDAVWCLGDLVGYGPRPNRCCQDVAALVDLCLAGNHDLGVLGVVDLADFSPDAAEAATWTQAVLSDEARAYLQPLRPTGTRDGIELYHASPRDPVWDYVLSLEVALESLRLAGSRLVLVGHSHVALAVSLDGKTVRGGAAPDGTEADLSRGDWLLNPGSVGQPRDGDPRAAYLLLDLAEGRAAFHRVAYPVDRTQRELRERGLPETLALRLAEGL